MYPFHKLKLKNICVYNFVPPIQKYNTAENPEYPYLGTDEERKHYALYFNLKQLVSYSIHYLNCNHYFYNILNYFNMLFYYILFLTHHIINQSV